MDAIQLGALQRLEAACIASNGGRLKISWPSLRSRPPGRDNDFLWVAPTSDPVAAPLEVLGFLGLYQWRPEELEICGMVHPEHRRLGIASLLYESASAEVARRKPGEVLLVVDRIYEGGAAFARSFGGALEHSEHRMEQRREPSERAGKAPVTVRDAREEDASFISECLSAAFGDPHVGEFAGVLVIETEKDRVGMMRVERDGQVASIYGFAVLPAEQGKGYGRSALRTVTSNLRSDGIGTIALEVASTNDSALGLYQSCGFDALGTEDYYAMPVGRGDSGTAVRERL
ncbi:MAG: GNAT family N-acetyltransferase [Acidimicrobiales bacterium]